MRTARTFTCVPPLSFDGIRNCVEQCKHARTTPHRTVYHTHGARYGYPAVRDRHLVVRMRGRSTPTFT